MIYLCVRFMVDDAGSLIDLHTAKMYDYFEEVLPLLNQQEADVDFWRSEALNSRSENDILWNEINNIIGEGYKCSSAFNRYKKEIFKQI